jgi:hypothetical protein
LTGRLTQHNERGWRATFYTTGMEQLSDERDGHWVGAHAVARDRALRALRTWLDSWSGRLG